MKKDNSIQIIRIIAMFSIVLCHLVKHYHSNLIAMTGQFFNVGVYIFLFISGYLYSLKKIDDKKQFYLKRFFKIIFPMYIFIIILSLIHLLNGSFECKYLFIYLFNLQYYFGGMVGAKHLWFITIIMICYFIIPFLYKITNKNKTNIIKFNLLLILVGLISMYINEKLSFTFLYLAVFVFGYMYKIYKEKIKIKNWLVIIILAIAIILRLVLRNFIDGTIYYDILTSWVTHTMLTFGLFYMLKKNIKNNNEKNSVLINHLDQISYYIYITHYMYLMGPFELMNLTNNLLLNTLVVIFISYISAILLYKFEKILNNCFSKI